jgi:hypothetical protein
MLFPMVSRPVYLWIKHLSGDYYQIFITVRHLRVCWWGALSLTRGQVCRLQLLQVLPEQSFPGLNPVGLVTIFYCLSFKASIFVASYDSQSSPCHYNYNFSYINTWDQALFIGDNREICNRNCDKTRTDQKLKYRIKLIIYWNHFVPTTSAICGVKLNTRDQNHIRTNEESILSYWSSLRVGNRIADKGDPNGRDVQMFGLVGRFLVFPSTLEYWKMDKVQKAGNSKLTGVFVMLFGPTVEMFFFCPCCFTIAAILVTFSTVLFVNFRRP